MKSRNREPELKQISKNINEEPEMKLKKKKKKKTEAEKENQVIKIKRINTWWSQEAESKA